MEMTPEKPQSQMDEAAAARKIAADAAKKKASAMKQAAADRAAGKGPKILAKVNMLAKDGTRLFSGKETHISQGEYDRLKSEPRFESKPHFVDAKSSAKAAADDEK